MKFSQVLSSVLLLILILSSLAYSQEQETNIVIVSSETAADGDTVWVLLNHIKADKTGGTGLGLYIVKIFIEAMGGTVGYESNGDYEGSNFWMTIPKRVVLYE